MINSIKMIFNKLVTQAKTLSKRIYYHPHLGGPYYEVRMVTLCELICGIIIFLIFLGISQTFFPTKVQACKCCRSRKFVLIYNLLRLEICRSLKFDKGHSCYFSPRGWLTFVQKFKGNTPFIKQWQCPNQNPLLD